MTGKVKTPGSSNAQRVRWLLDLSAVPWTASSRIRSGIDYKGWRSDNKECRTCLESHRTGQDVFSFSWHPAALLQGRTSASAR